MNNYQDWDPVVIRGKIDKTREKEKYVKLNNYLITFIPQEGKTHKLTTNQSRRSCPGYRIQ